MTDREKLVAIHDLVNPDPHIAFLGGEQITVSQDLLGMLDKTIRFVAKGRATLTDIERLRRVHDVLREVVTIIKA